MTYEDYIRNIEHEIKQQRRSLALALDENRRLREERNLLIEQRTDRVINAFRWNASEDVRPFFTEYRVRLDPIYAEMRLDNVMVATAELPDRLKQTAIEHMSRKIAMKITEVL